MLVTGLRGFTGRYLAAALHERGVRVVGFVQGVAQVSDEIACDLTDDTSVRETITRIQPTHVVHLAALAFAGNGDARAFYDVNLFGTLNVLAALANLEVDVRNNVASRLLGACQKLQHYTEVIPQIPLQQTLHWMLGREP